MSRWAELGVVVLALLAATASTPPAIVERWFSLWLYPAVQRTLTPMVNLLPVAILDALILLGAAAVLLACGRGARQAWRARRPGPALRVLAHLTAAAAVLYLAFLILWGFNYRRITMEDRVEIASGPPAAGAALALGLRAVEELNQLHAPAHRAGWADEPWRNAALRAAFVEVQRTLSDAPPAVPGRLKPTLLGLYFRWTGVDGMINPFGLEVLANPDLLPFERPFVAAHEWAHLAGYADEAEASFVGWLTTMHADTPAQYSGWLYLYGQLGGDVLAAERATLADGLAPGPREDLARVAERLRRGQWPMLRVAGWSVYDQYLKANRVEEGVRSYGAAVSLILRARVDAGWTPVRRTAGTRP